ncbi:inactive all-trans-retinol 13,14-reductase-like isoform X1 [Hemibagrus wyckioides]|uniref:inactive all-trans-retinol 13,14-reductase-like isoform X1 n=2 Tax=Hemibagrus wyckioides TaxID=337641 RepID=UPI00266C1B6D|nr:inactive all-trans-retinol 13,14-reductase-like isoform X1 [Hemibagrus wyckioides]
MVMWLLVLLVWFLLWAGGTYWYLFGKPSPFSLESVRPPGPLELDQKKRSKILKQGFRKEKVPENLDAIVIGSGIGGMTAAATLAKLGKRVLVLEQHDQAGGCCHTFTEKGFEFDVGLHYIGQLHENSLLKVIMDQITEGQLQFVKLDKHFDTLVIGSGEKIRKYTIYSGKTEMEEHLKAQFPDDTKAVEEFFKIMKISARKTPFLAALKLIPQWMALFLLKSGIADLCSSIFRLVGTNATALANSLTSNKDLHIIFNYFFYGVPPKQSSSVINALLLHHYKRGAYYPKGGASEIPFHITKVIQKYGGRVLVRAPVNRILVDNNGAAYGVTVKKDQEDVEVRAPVIISNCGVFNTFQKFLPAHIQTKPEIQKRVNMMRPGRGCLLVFSGFDATQEELGINSTNTWLFKSNDMDAIMDEFFSMGKDEAPDNIPMMYFTFPSAKDPTSKIRHPGKSCMTLLMMVKYEWFEEWKDTPVRKRGDDYLAYKMRFANSAFDWACSQFPKLRDKLVFQEVSTPLSNGHYLGSYLGAMYSAEQNLERFQVEAMARNRCDTPVKNLFITGQDVFSCGIAGALHGGLLCASTVLKQIVYIDLMMLKKKLKRKKVRRTDEHVKKLL